MAGFFLFLYDLFRKHRMAFFTAVTGLAVLAGYTGSQIGLEEDISKAMPADEKTERLNEVFRQSRFTDKLVVTLSLSDTAKEDPDLLALFADSLVSRLSERFKPEYIREITGITSDEMMREVYDSLYENIPLYLDETDYDRLEQQLTDSVIGRTLGKNYRALLSPASLALKAGILRDPLGLTPLVLKKLFSFQFDENFEMNNGYIYTKGKKHLLFFITPAASSRETARNSKLIGALDESITSLQNDFHHEVKADYFGAAAVAVSNALQIKKDIRFTVALSVALLMLYLGFYFRRISVLFIIFLPLLFGGLVSLAALALMKTTVSVIALGIGAILLGITIDYSLHVLSHFRDSGSARQVIRELAMPLIISCLITALDFLCLLFVKSEALQDLGLFAAISVFNAALVALTVLPQLMKAGKRTEKVVTAVPSTGLASRFFAYRFDKNRILIAVIVIFSVYSAFILDQVEFEADMMKMNFMDQHLQESENALNRFSHVSRKSVFLIATGKTLNDALHTSEQLLHPLDSLKNNLVVKQYSSATSLLLSDSMQEVKIGRWNNFWSEERKALLKQSLVQNGLRYKFKASAFEPFFQLLDKKFMPLDNEVHGKIKDNFLHDYIDQQPGQTTVVTLVKVDDEQKPVVYKSFENRDNLLILDKQYLTNRFVNVLKDDFALLANLSFFLVLLILILSYGRWELGLISFLPMIIAWIWILGIMVLTGIKFNIINIIISTFICGLGIDYSIFIMSGLLHEYKYGHAVLSSYKKSIFLSATTTILGVGAMIFARHPALHSIAILSVIGMLCVVLMAYTIEPLLFGPLVLNRKAKGKLPWTFLTLFLSFFAFAYFFVGCILLTVLGLIFPFLPMPMKNKKYIFHFILGTFTGSLIYVMINVRKKIINPNREQFKKPAVVIANHQSFLDILLLTMINPKMILLTNDWVYNSPFFGRVVKFADFYPVSKGFENSIDSLREKVSNGYSIVIWPEGTRSKTHRMGRFHKGAFFIAEQLQLDILPILLHGTGDTMSKGDDIMLKNGRLTLKYLDRITPSDTRFGNGYAERTKQVARYFKQEYARLRLERETPSYYRDRLVKNYIYKGPILEWYLRIKLRLEDHYTLFHELAPRTGKITDIGCGYGFMTYMLGFLSEERKLTGIDYDEDKIAVANNCVAKSEQFTFVSGDVTNMPIEPADCFIISDVLHYFPKDKQQALVQKCLEQLNPGGTLIIRDGNASLKKRHRGTRLSEFFSTNIGFNKTGYRQLFFLAKEDLESYCRGFDVSRRVIDNTRFTSNIIFVAVKKNGQTGKHHGNL